MKTNKSNLVNCSFRDFINESSYKKPLTEDEVIKLIKTKCKDIDFENKRYLLRSMSSSDDMVLLTGQDGERKSISTTNHYTKIIDHNLKGTGYPLRSKSIICSNSLYFVHRFAKKDENKIFVILPFDGVKIGVCEDEDIWDSYVELNGNKREIASLNPVYVRSGVEDTSFETIVDGIAKSLEDDESPLKRLFKDKDKNKIKEDLEKAYSIEALKFSLIESKDISKLEFSRECWIGGSCIAIRKSVFDEMIEKNMV